jgi:hypothetical protein
MLSLQTVLTCLIAVAVLAVLPTHTRAAREQQHAMLKATEQCTATELGSGSCSTLSTANVRGSKSLSMHSSKPENTD